MKAKWRFTTFIIILTLLGIGLQQLSIPNQEIVVQFNNDNVSLTETQNTIAIVKKQLQDIGAENIKVYQGTNGILKITYHSDVDVVSIKKLLSEENELALGLTGILQKENPSNPSSNKKSNTYKLDVSKIQKNNDSEGDFNDLALEIKPKIERVYYPDFYFYTAEISIPEKKNIEKTAYLAYSRISIVLDRSLHNIPEVRAGPAFS